MKQVILIHGFSATIKSNWFPWLVNTINCNLGLSVNPVSLPHSTKPNITTWINSIHNEVNNPSEETFFIAHSLGCITLLKYIAGLPDNTRIGGIILISAFDESIPLLPLTKSFVGEKPDYIKILSKVESVAIIGSTNDIIVPIGYTKNVAKQLHTSVIEIQKAGHFTTQDGYRKFPELYTIICEMLGPSRNAPHS